MHNNQKLNSNSLIINNQRITKQELWKQIIYGSKLCTQYLNLLKIKKMDYNLTLTYVQWMNISTIGKATYNTLNIYQIYQYYLKIKRVIENM